MDVSVVTPSLNMFDYLKRCHASIVDQQHGMFEHIVVDGGSTDGTAQWLRNTSEAVGIIGPDDGMYDAINKGLKLARGEVLAYLNCDEQYLSGALSRVKNYFAAHPEIDVIAGHTLLIRPNGSLIAFRKVYPLPLPVIRAGHIQMLSSSLFFRRRIIDDGEYFDSRFRDVGDHEFVIRLMSKKYRFAFYREYLSAFTMTGSNRGRNANAFREGNLLEAATPPWIIKLSGPLTAVRWSIKLLSGAYFERMPLEYAVYQSGDSDQRTVFVARRASFRWRTF
jgi:glycosyltransferase involved in cell wall biosynthesis